MEDFSFFQGLDSIMNQVSGASEEKALQEKFFKPEKNTKYLIRFLEEQANFVIFKEHNFVPIFFPKKDGTKVPGHSNFFCDGTPNCPLCNATLIDDKGEEYKLRPRFVMALPIYIEKSFEIKGMREIEKNVQESRILILPAGKSKANWHPIYNFAQDKGTLKDRQYKFYIVGERLEQVWNWIPQDPDKVPFDYDLVDTLDVSNILKNSGRYKSPKELERLSIRSELKAQNSATSNYSDEDDIMSKI